VDGCNVAWNYNECKGFSTRGLQVCLEWFLARNFSKVVAFVPRSYVQAPVSHKRPARSAHAAKSGFYQNRADDIDGLKRLHERGLVRFTPQGGDDDAFIIEFAYQSDGWIVSNDNYREFRKHDIPAEQRDWLLWRKIFYTFIGDCFIPTAPKIHRKPPAHLGQGLQGGMAVQAASGADGMPSGVAYDVSLQLACDHHRERLEHLVALEQIASEHQLPLPPPDSSQPVTLDASTASSTIGTAALATAISRLEDVQLETHGMVSEMKLLQLDQDAHFRDALSQMQQQQLSQGAVVLQLVAMLESLSSVEKLKTVDQKLEQVEEDLQC